MQTQPTYPVVTTQLVAVYVSISHHAPGDTPVLLQNDLLLGWGPSQCKAPLTPTTIGALRESWGDDTLGGDLNPATKAWLYTNDDGNGGSTVVLVNMPILAG